MKAMKAKNKHDPMRLDGYGTRQNTKEVLYKPNNIYSGQILSYLAVLLFTAIDFACLNSAWTTVQNDNQYMIMLISLGCAVVMDIPIAISGLIFKEYIQKVRDKKESIIIACLCITSFFAVLAFYIGFRMVTKDTTFSSSSATIVNSLSTEVDTSNDGGDAKVFYAGLFSAILPFCTSLASFIISYYSYDPLKIKLHRLDKAIIKTESNMIEIKQAMEEVGTLYDHAIFQIHTEKDAYNAFVFQIKAESLLRKQAVRAQIMKNLSSPAEVAAIQEAGERLNQNASLDNCPNESENYYISSANGLNQS